MFATLILAFTAAGHAPAAFRPVPQGAAPAAVTLAADPDQGTPADSLYRTAQRYLNRSEYQRAVDAFRELRRRYPRSARTGDAYYWEAFALQRLGGTTNLRVARERLKTQAAEWPNAGTRTDAGGLRVRIEQMLAETGDQAAVAWLDSTRNQLGAGAPRPAGGEDDETAQGCDEERLSTQMMALQALMSMNRERAVPLLKGIVARRDGCSARLRRQAVFILGQQAADSEVTPLMLDVVRNDPDRQVRKMALFALGQSRSPAAVDALTQVLRTSDDAELQKNAVFALSQSGDDRAAGVLRDVITRPGASDEVVKTAVLFLGQRHGDDNAAFLRDAYPRMRSEEAKKMVLMTLAQRGDSANARWLMDRVLDRSETTELRRTALYFAGTQSDAVSVARLSQLYAPTLDLELRRQVLFVLSQRHEPAAVDKLIEIARNDPDREMRRQALFWLGQSGDPRATELLEQVLQQ
jgi:HEAT repeat protein